MQIKSVRIARTQTSLKSQKQKPRKRSMLNKMGRTEDRRAQRKMTMKRRRRKSPPRQRERIVEIREMERRTAVRMKGRPVRKRELKRTRMEDKSMDSPSRSNHPWEKHLIYRCVLYSQAYGKMVMIKFH